VNTLLQYDSRNIGDVLDAVRKQAEAHLKNQHTKSPGRFVPDLELKNLPVKGIGAQSVLALFENHYAPQLNTSAGPRYFGFVTGGSTPAAIAGDWLVSTYDQNTCGSNDSIAPQLERQTIHFLKQLFGIEKEYFGSFVTGATMSNMVGLALGRQWVGEQSGIDFSQVGLSNSAPIPVFSGTPHSSAIKSLSMLGMGRNAVQKINTLPDREAVDLSALEKALQSIHTPAIVIANAGTVNTVDFDDLEAIGQLKSKYNFWLHVDAAFGGFAAVSEKFAHLMKGINHADSITIDAHKWLNVPYDAAIQLTRHKSLQLKVFQNNAAYLTDPEKSPDYFHYTPESSRRFRALPAWFTLMAYGREGYAEIVDRNCSMAHRLGEKISASSRFRLLAPVRMNVVCFTLTLPTLTMDTVTEFLAKIRDDGRAYFTPTVYNGVPAIRAAVSNWQTGEHDIDLTWDALNDCFVKSAF
jgi:glutamate/tyrosine decarboxylase-like PLP-dependent enzyme